MSSLQVKSRSKDLRSVIDEGMAAELSAASEAKDLTKESAVRHKRHWVRLTRLCNQRCLFCLDSWNHNGTYVDTGQLFQYIELGQRLGRERLILSGGEPTIHPDYVKFIRHGRKVGYDWIQTVTNGMMFAYPEFTRKCIQAGLDEVTMSIHGHTARIQDRLTGVKGAFEQAIQGIRNIKALSGGRTVINIDIVINKQNIGHLREIIDFFRTFGIHEFDLLYMVPFGRGFGEYRQQLYFNLDDHHEDLQRALEPSREPGVFIWTNRLPPEHLEHFEDLIQAPHKLHSEVQGGLHNFEGFMKMGVAPDCHGERCDFCFLKGLCHDHMFMYRERLEAGTFERLRVDLAEDVDGEAAAGALTRQVPSTLIVQGADRTEVDAFLAEGTYARDDLDVVVELRGAGESAGLFTDARADVGRVVVRDAGELAVTVDAAVARLESGDETAEVEVVLGADTLAWLLDESARCEPLIKAGLLVANLPNFEYLSAMRETGVGPEEITKLAALGMRLMNVARCLGGQRSEPGGHFELSRAMLDDKGQMKVSPYVQRYITGEYYKKSLRCRGCAFTEQCKGMHIQFLRAHGFSSLEPIPLPQDVSSAA
jgi:pyruvate-formate lyase-activating enzyme